MQKQERKTGFAVSAQPNGLSRNHMNNSNNILPGLDIHSDVGKLCRSVSIETLNE